MNEIAQKVLSILVEVKENSIAADQFTAESRIVEDIGLDSLEMINFILRVEDEFEVEINFEEFDYATLDDIKTFAAFIETLRKPNLTGISA